jgi:molybdopterin biosynthesis enzyme MoaB
MAPRKKGKAARTTHVPISDDELIGRLQDEAPEVLQATISEAAFDTAVQELLQNSSSEIQHFYCRKCGEYHVKTHPHSKHADR